MARKRDRALCGPRSGSCSPAALISSFHVVSCRHWRSMRIPCIIGMTLAWLMNDSGMTLTWLLWDFHGDWEYVQGTYVRHCCTARPLGWPIHCSVLRTPQAFVGTLETREPLDVKPGYHKTCSSSGSQFVGCQVATKESWPHWWPFGPAPPPPVLASTRGLLLDG